VPGGALMQDGKWKHSRSRGKYLFKVDQLSDIFRTRFVKQLRKLIREKKLKGKAQKCNSKKNLAGNCF
jgi:uncharacterized protein YajQ (UPF0234 family)